MEKNQKATPQLIDPDKSGTLIIGHARCGTHFVQALIEHEWAQNKDRWPNRSCAAHGEWVDGQEPSPARLLGKLQGLPQYHVVIFNGPLVKDELLCNQSLLDGWHVVRMVHEDKLRWFLSFYFFCHLPWQQNLPKDIIGIKPVTFRGSGESQPALYRGSHEKGEFFDINTLMYMASWSLADENYIDQNLVGTCLPPSSQRQHHFGAASSTYREIIDQTPDLVDLDIIAQVLMTACHTHLLCQLVPADVELSYDQLAQMGNQAVKWQPNDYGDIEIAQIFKHSRVLQQWLERWSGPWPGVFKEKK